MAERKITLEYLKEAVMEPVNFWGMAGFAVAVVDDVRATAGGEIRDGQIRQPVAVQVCHDERIRAAIVLVTCAGRETVLSAGERTVG